MTFDSSLSTDLMLTLGILLFFVGIGLWILSSSLLHLAHHLRLRDNTVVYVCFAADVVRLICWLTALGFFYLYADVSRIDSVVVLLVGGFVASKLADRLYSARNIIVLLQHGLSVGVPLYMRDELLGRVTLVSSTCIVVSKGRKHSVIFSEQLIRSVLTFESDATAAQLPDGTKIRDS